MHRLRSLNSWNPGKLHSCNNADSTWGGKIQRNAPNTLRLLTQTGIFTPNLETLIKMWKPTEPQWNIQAAALIWCSLCEPPWTRCGEENPCVPSAAAASGNTSNNNKKKKKRYRKCSSMLHLPTALHGLNPLLVQQPGIIQKQRPAAGEAIFYPSIDETRLPYTHK